MKKPLLNLRAVISAAALGTAFFAAPVEGAVLVDYTQDIAPLGGTVHQVYVPSFSAAVAHPSVDLTTGLTPTVGGPHGQTNESSGGVGAWTDGSIATVYRQDGTAGDIVDHAPYGTVGDGTTVNFDLGGTFDLAYINVFLGWNDGGRDSAAFQVWVAGADASYSQIGSAGQAAAGAGNLPDEPVTHWYKIHDPDAGSIPGVQFVEIRFGASDNGWVGFSEIDIVAVPEPGIAALGLLGGLGLLRRKRR